MTEEQIQQLHNLLDEGREIKYESFHILGSGVQDHVYLEAAKSFDIWVAKVKTFAVSNLADHPLYSDLIKSIDDKSRFAGSNTICNILQAILESL